MESDEILVNFDVSSLFTNVPVGEAVSIRSERLMEDKTPGDRTSLSPERIADILEMCLSPPTSSFVEGRCSDGLSGLCCGGQPLRGAGTRDGANQTQTVEEVC